MKLPEPDWDKLREIRLEAERLDGEDKLSYESWKGLLKDAAEAAQGCSDLTEFMGRFARAGWSGRLREELDREAPAA